MSEALFERHGCGESHVTVILRSGRRDAPLGNFEESSTAGKKRGEEERGGWIKWYGRMMERESSVSTNLASEDRGVGCGLLRFRVVPSPTKELNAVS